MDGNLVKHFFDYNPTKEEIDTICGDPDDPFTTEHLRFFEGTDSERFKIAILLYGRGEHKAALKMVKSIENAEYREDMLRIVQSWINLPKGALW